MDETANVQETGEKKTMKWKKPLLIILGVIIAAYLCAAFYFSNRFAIGTKINGVNVSNKTVSQVIGIFEKKASDYSLTIQERKGQKETLSSRQLKTSFAGEDDVREVRKKQNPILWISGLFGGQHYNDVNMFDYDKTAFTSAFGKLNCLQPANITKVRNAAVVYGSNSYIIRKEEPGNELIKDKAVKTLTNAIEDGISSVDLDQAGAYKKVTIKSDNSKLKSMLSMLTKACKGSITYKFGKQVVVLDSRIYHDWFNVKDTSYKIDNSKMENWVMKFAYKYNTYGAWHKFKTHNGKKVKVYGGPYGWRISREKEEAAVTKMLKDGSTATREPYWRQKGKVYDDANGGDVGTTYVEVDVANQMLYYYKKGKLKLSSDVVTGMNVAGRRTPEGVGFVLYKQRNATLNGQGYSSPVSYWMPFNGNAGMHDASWRNSFGGSIYQGSGSHGCVNMPTYAAANLYKMIEVDTPVVVYY